MHSLICRLLAAVLLYSCHVLRLIGPAFSVSFVVMPCISAYRGVNHSPCMCRPFYLVITSYVLRDQVNKQQLNVSTKMCMLSAYYSIIRTIGQLSKDSLPELQVHAEIFVKNLCSIICVTSELCIHFFTMFSTLHIITSYSSSYSFI